MNTQSRQPKGTPAGGQFALEAHAEADVHLEQESRPLSEQTPREIDTELADLYAQRWQALDTRDRAYDSVHWALGERQGRKTGGRRGWPTTDVDAVAALREKLDAEQVPSWDVERHERALARIARLTADIAALGEQESRLEDEYAARPWSRFFLVTSSDGHIHSSMACHTCRPSTRFGWLPDLSGKTEEQAVAEHGAILCTACYPSAPVEWTRGREEDPNTCPGSNQESATPPKYSGRSRYGTCPVCGEPQTVGYSGIRKHKRKP